MLHPLGIHLVHWCLTACNTKAMSPNYLEVFIELWCDWDWGKDLCYTTISMVCCKRKIYELLALLFVSYFLNSQSKQCFCRIKASCLWYEALGIPCESTVGYSKFSWKMLRMLTFMLMLNMQYNCRIEIFHCYVSYICKGWIRSWKQDIFNFLDFYYRHSLIYFLKINNITFIWNTETEYLHFYDVICIKLKLTMYCGICANDFWGID